MYPRLVIAKNKFAYNAKTLKEHLKSRGVSMMAVTKSFCADPVMVDVLTEVGVDYLADSRIENIRSMESTLPKVLLRIPMRSELEEAAKYCDVVFVSEKETILELNEEAKKLDKKLQVLLMVDLGDLREGVLQEDALDTLAVIDECSHLSLLGIGTNLSCYGGVIPSEENLGQLASLAREYRDSGKELSMVSGGNSSSVTLLDSGKMPEEINNLRLGEVLILGRETAAGEHYLDLHEDVFRLEAQLVELKTKPSKPIGEIGMNAFGEVPYFEDKGPMLRGILAIGKQDVDYEHLTPREEGVEILGGSSDHLLVDVTNVPNIQLGDVLRFDLDYSSVLTLFTSPYVKRHYE